MAGAVPGRVEFDPARGFTLTVRRGELVENYHFGIPPENKPRPLFGHEPPRRPLLDFHLHRYDPVNHRPGVHQSAATSRVGLREAAEFVIGMKAVVEEMLETENPDLSPASKAYREAEERLKQMFWDDDAVVRARVTEHDAVYRDLINEGLAHIVLSSADRDAI